MSESSFSEWGQQHRPGAARQASLLLFDLQRLTVMILSFHRSAEANFTYCAFRKLSKLHEHISHCRDEE